MAPAPDSNEIAEFLRITFEAIDQGISIYDSELRLVAWNHQYAELGLMPEAFLREGASLEEAYFALATEGVFGEGDPDELAREHVRALKHGPMIESELLTTPAGRIIRIRRFALPNGGVCATFSDITKETMIEEQLRQSTKMDAIGRLVGGAAHDFNNVLATIFGAIDMALETNDGVQLKQHLHHALEAAETGARLTHQLLAFARKQPLSPTVLRPAEVLNNLSGMVRTLIGEQIDVECVYDAGLWNIEVDRNQFEHAIINLSVNARDAMANGGKLTIEATNARVDEEYARVAGIERGQYVCISVTDTGMGMTKETIEKAFEPFFTTKEAGQGTGLGLAMVHGFIRQSNGHIRLYSELGQGTVAKIYLPRIDHDATDAADSAHVPEADLIDGMSILVVEDNEILRRTIVAQLESVGVKVSDAATGVEALEYVNQDAPFDLLLSDVVLPKGISGRELAKKINEITPSTKVIFMSGYSENSIIHHGRLDKGVTLLQKPFRKIDLIRELARAIED